MKNGFNCVLNMDERRYDLVMDGGRTFALPIKDKELKAQLAEEINGLIRKRCPEGHGRMKVLLGKRASLICETCCREKAYLHRMEKLSVEELESLLERHKNNVRQIKDVLKRKGRMA